MRALLFVLIPICAFSQTPARNEGSRIGAQEKITRPTQSSETNRPAPPAQAVIDQPGSKERPFVVDTEGHKQTEDERAQSNAEKQHVRDVERDTIFYARLTGWTTFALAIIGIGGVGAAIWTLHQIKRQADLMDVQVQDSRKSSNDNTENVRASIAEAVRSATAMEGVAQSMAVNAESVKTSVAINRQIADMQKLATMLHSRAYLSVFFNAATFQDENHVFEVEAIVRNHGNTPAYDVTFKAVAQIVPVPIPGDFAFPLPETAAGGSVSLMAPGTTKVLRRVVSGRVPDEEVEAIKGGGPPRCLAMWGIVDYRDAFSELRHVRFAFGLHWIPWLPGFDKDKDGNPVPPKIMSFDTASHNDAN